MKKVIFYLLCLSLLFSNIGVCATGNATNDEETPCAKIVFDINFKTKNIKKVAYSGGSMIIEKRNGIYGLKRLNKDPNLYCAVDIDDNFIYSDESMPLDITVEYFDEGTGPFTIAYKVGDVWKKATPAILTDTKEWKKHTFHMEDIVPNNNTTGGDFRLALWAQGMGFAKNDIVFHSMEIRKGKYNNPLSCSLTSDFTGRIFGNQDDKILKLNLKNVTSATISSVFNYSVSDSEENIILTGSFDAEVEPSQEITKTVDVNEIKKFGIYKIKFDAENKTVSDGKEDISTTEQEFEFSVINKSNLNERNPHLWINTHAKRFNVPDESANAAAYAGFVGVRDTASWHNVEETRGVYSVPEETDRYFKNLKANNLKLNFLASYGNTVYYAPGDSYVSAPETDEQHDAYARYVSYVVKNYTDVIDAVEVWNEYDLKGFNPKLADEQNYVAFLKKTYNAVKEIDKDINVIGMSLATQKVEKRVPYFEAGALDYIDAIGYHTYADCKDLPLARSNHEALKAIEKPYGTDKPVWVTETGATTYKQADGKRYEDADRAIMLVKSYVSSISEDIFDEYMIYLLYNKGLIDTESEDNFGLLKSPEDLTNPFGAMESYLTVSGMNKVLAGAEPTKHSIDKFGINSYSFLNQNGDTVTVVWNNGHAKTVGITTEANEIEVLDKFTNSMGKMNSQDGSYDVTVGSDPIYIIGKYNDISYTESLYHYIVGRVMMLKDTTQKDHSLEEYKPQVITWEGQERLMNLWRIWIWFYHFAPVRRNLMYMLAMLFLMVNLLIGINWNPNTLKSGLILQRKEIWVLILTPHFFHIPR